MTSSGDEQGSLLPAALVGAAILALAGVFIFWPAGDGAKSKADGDDKTASAKSASSAGGLAARKVDSAANTNRASSAATQRSRGLAQPGEVEAAPEPKTLEEKIEAKKRQLQLAEMKVQQIEKGLERYPKIREESIAAADNPEFETRNFDRKKERMELNLERAKADVEQFSAELEELEAEG